MEEESFVSKKVEIESGVFMSVDNNPENKDDSSEGSNRWELGVSLDIDNGLVNVSTYPAAIKGSEALIIVRMNGGSKKQSVFNPDFIGSFNRGLDQALSLSRAFEQCVLFITGTGSRFFSSGLDLKWLNHNHNDTNDNDNEDDQHSRNPRNHLSELSSSKTLSTRVKSTFGESSDELFNRNLTSLNKEMCELYQRLLQLELPVVSVVNGHCFGASSFVSMCCDWRIIRRRTDDDDRKGPLICFPLMKHSLNISKGWREILSTKVSHTTFRDSILLSRQWSSQDGFDAGIYDEMVDGQDSHCFSADGDSDDNKTDGNTLPIFYQNVCRLPLIEEALECSKNRANLVRLKYDMHHSAIVALSNHFSEPLTRVTCRL